MVAGYQLVLHSSGNSCIGLLLTSKRAEGRAKKGYGHTVFENHRKSLIQHCERSELRLHFEWTKSLLKSTKYDQFWRVFENLKLAVKQCYQTGQISRTKIGVKCRNSNATFWVIFKQCGAEEPPKETEKIASSKSFLTK